LSNNENTVKVVKSVIQVLHDGQQGMASIGSELKDAAAKHFFLEETQVRANYAAELANELHRLGVHDVNETGTASGAVHRIWGELKSKLGGGDHTLLETAEQGEDAAKQQYAEALQETLPGTVRDLLLQQQAHILESHNVVRSLRDSTAS
jgi:uncharacterized protein (TIGR02284 family)